MVYFESNDIAASCSEVDCFFAPPQRNAPASPGGPNDALWFPVRRYPLRKSAEHLREALASTSRFDVTVGGHRPALRRRLRQREVSSFARYGQQTYPQSTKPLLAPVGLANVLAPVRALPARAIGPAWSSDESAGLSVHMALADAGRFCGIARRSTSFCREGHKKRFRSFVPAACCPHRENPSGGSTVFVFSISLPSREHLNGARGASFFLVSLPPPVYCSPLFAIIRNSQQNQRSTPVALYFAVLRRSP